MLVRREIMWNSEWRNEHVSKFDLDFLVGKVFLEILGRVTSLFFISYFGIIKKKKT